MAYIWEPHKTETGGRQAAMLSWEEGGGDWGFGGKEGRRVTGRWEHKCLINKYFSALQRHWDTTFLCSAAAHPTPPSAAHQLTHPPCSSLVVTLPRMGPPSKFLAALREKGEALPESLGP